MTSLLSKKYGTTAKSQQLGDVKGSTYFLGNRLSVLRSEKTIENSTVIVAPVLFPGFSDASLRIDHAKSILILPWLARSTINVPQTAPIERSRKFLPNKPEKTHRLYWSSLNQSHLSNITHDTHVCDTSTAGEFYYHVPEIDLCLVQSVFCSWLPSSTTFRLLGTKVRGNKNDAWICMVSVYLASSDIQTVFPHLTLHSCMQDCSNAAMHEMYNHVQHWNIWKHIVVYSLLN